MCSLGFHSLKISPHWEWSEARAILSPLLFNVYMDNLSLQLHRQSIGCTLSGSVVNHMLYADDIVLFALSVKAFFTRATFGLFVARHRDWRRRPTRKPLSRRLSAEVEHVPILAKK